MILAALPSPSPSQGHEILAVIGRAWPWALLVGACLVLLLVIKGRRRSRPPSDLRSPTSGWATIKELKQAGLSVADTTAWAGRLYLADRMGVWREGKKLRPKQASLFLWPGRSAIVVGPTGSGKTSAVVKPALLLWGPAPVLATTTKPDLLGTWQKRSEEGPCWLFDPTGSIGRPDLCVGWSPLWRCESWDRAVESAAAMLAPHARDTTAKNADHFAFMARQLLAPLLHAAALDGSPFTTVREWILSWELSAPLAILAAAHAEIARGELLGTISLEGDHMGDHMSGIRGTAMATTAWAIREAVRAAVDPGQFRQLDIDRLLNENGTLYIISPSRTMNELAPLISALVDAVAARALELAVRAGGRLSPPLLMALDEAANVAPIESLPSLLAEGGQQGVTCLVSLQDMSQAYSRWGDDQAHSLWNNASAHLILPGLRDPATLKLISEGAGEVKRWHQSVSNSSGSSSGSHSNSSQQRSDSWSLGLESLIRPEEVGRMDAEAAIMLARGLKPAWLMLSPMYLNEPEHNLPPGPVAAENLSAAPSSASDRYGAVISVSFSTPATHMRQVKPKIFDPSDWDEQPQVEVPRA